MSPLPGDAQIRAAAIRKAALRLLPLLALLYFVSFLDRVNVGFAAITMNDAIGLTSTTFGIGAGIFFIGYIVAALPSNLILHRVGAPLWIGVISVVWGLVSVMMAFVSTPLHFYVLRFFLGAAEAGFFPGVILYLSQWFPEDVRGTILSRFFVAVPLSTVLGAPLSGWLLEHPMFGLQGWQTMFVVEAAPAVLLGIIATFWLTDAPASAAWLSADERLALTTSDHGGNSSIAIALKSPIIWLFSLIYFLLVFAIYGFGFFAPLMLRDGGFRTPMTVGAALSLPYLLTAAAIIIWARHSDRSNERVWHVAQPAFLGGAGFFLMASSTALPIQLIGITMAVIGTYSACPVFWTLPTRYVSGAAAAAGIAVITGVGNLAGYVGPVLVGIMKDNTLSYAAGHLALGAGTLAAGLLVLVLRDKRDFG